jgi:NAD(P)-dependent dehydrogenase (short-subunit alcohol dehydrogenase family)
VNEKQILITGATNGIGLAAAEALAALGANLAIVGRSKTRTRIASARIRAAGGHHDTIPTCLAIMHLVRVISILGAGIGKRIPEPQEGEIGRRVRPLRM